MKRRGTSPRAAGRRLPGRPTAALLAEAVESLHEGVLVAERRLTPEGFRIIFANAALQQMTGYSAADLVRSGHGRLHVNENDLAEVRRWHRRGEGEEPLTGQGYLRHKNGLTLYAAWSFRVIRAGRGGRASHVVAVYRNLTVQRRLQEALLHAQRLDAVGRLAGGVAHDFNNLLSVINGYCEILADTVRSNAKARKQVAEIHQAGQRAALLVRQLLAFGRRQAMDPRVISLNRLVQENVDILRRLIGRDKQLQLSLDERVGAVRADPSQLQQVLLNLTINGRDALPAGGHITIGTSRREVTLEAGANATGLPPGTYTVLTVNDNGSGMDEETQAHLFEPFFTTKGEGNGTGLGLALVYGVVQQSGGYIFVHSAPGLGSTFEIFLPEAAEPVEAEPEVALALPVTRGHETILLAEEDEIVRKMLAGILTADGYRVLVVASPLEGLRLARREREAIELVALEVNDRAVEALRLIRTLQQKNPHLRVVTITAEGGAEVEFVPAGCQTTLVKPFALSALLRAVRRLLDAEPKDPPARLAKPRNRRRNA